MNGLGRFFSEVLNLTPISLDNVELKSDHSLEMDRGRCSGIFVRTGLSEVPFSSPCITTLSPNILTNSQIFSHHGKHKSAPARYSRFY